MCQVMSVLNGTKEVVVGSKISRREADALQAICDREDRSMSYVLRELAIRGLAYYLQDGLLKTTDAENDVIDREHRKLYSDKDRPESISNLAPADDYRIAYRPVENADNVKEKQKKRA